MLLCGDSFEPCLSHHERERVHEFWYRKPLTSHASASKRQAEQNSLDGADIWASLHVHEYEAFRLSDRCLGCRTPGGPRLDDLSVTTVKTFWQVSLGLDH